MRLRPSRCSAAAAQAHHQLPLLVSLSTLSSPGLDSCHSLLCVCQASIAATAALRTVATATRASGELCQSSLPAIEAPPQYVGRPPPLLSLPASHGPLPRGQLMQLGMPPRASLTGSFSVSDENNVVVCPLRNHDGSACRKRCTGVSALFTQSLLHLWRAIVD